ncbi:CCA tRNA nucleotidyltransferase [Candidatus Beckwithbacteria bacterium CG_4_10_14_0_2_um_filter_47_25]|uniref:CCA tRNA nucleotidyltransferase n=1 Tax=Candidatus Beckwithbacteria bacterium CG_4_10_14_0_2_um_filter_47_25 TaxID=1974493 RepID=A0A2M7W6U6_9BACT|nr:MAG: CCA tRNA nucleotidyltransferase [Candidatus Beckwithbacteria bacterium CG_4_10_14_0_2_um_filter_47_25]
MKFKLPSPVIKVLQTLERDKFEAFVVGGAVRDLLTHVPVTDWDFTTNATPEQIQKLFPDSFYDNRFGTVGVKFDEQVLEITTYRSESGYSDRRRPDRVKWGKTIAEDLTRRDFTVNAMALTDKLEIIDPFHGQKDLKQKIIRAVGQADKRFNEDALRMLRAIRIASQLGFLIEPKTLEAIVKNSALIKQISAERVRDELLKIIASPFPKEGLQLMFNAGLLAHILPELIATRGVDQAGHHTKDVWNHSLDSLAASPSAETIVRLATLLHDIGKPVVKSSREGKKITFYNHEVVGARMAKTIARRLKLSKKQTDLLWLLVRWHMFQYEPKMTDKAIRRFITRVGRENINKMIQLRVGDRVGGGSQASSWRLREFQERIKQVLYKPFDINDLKVDGTDAMNILNIKPGPKVGKILKKIFNEVLADAKKNDREYLLKKINDFA